MIDKLTGQVNFQGNALLLRAERQRVLASNIANADTPGYVGRDFRFTDALRAATEVQEPRMRLQPTASQSGRNVGTSDVSGMSGSTTAGRLSLPTPGFGRPDSALGYSVQTQPSLDGNSVDMDRERAAFVDNAVRYEATLRFINGQVKTILSAIQGQ